jgi:transketolase
MFTSLENIAYKPISEITNLLRFKVIKMSHDARSAHLGSALSCLDILASLYFRILNVKPDQPFWDRRDILILSKGHAAMALYAVLAAKGFFPERFLDEYNRDGSKLMEHPPASGLHGVEAATGSLGHGLAMAAGEALAIKLRKQNRRVFCVISDGETNEGAIWEAAMFAAAQGLSNLVVYLDYNRWQATGRSDQILNQTSHFDRWKAFGWEVDIIDGHDSGQIILSSKNLSNKPKIVIANTIKGKGVSFMEDDNNWHYRVPDAVELERARLELGF